MKEQTLDEKIAIAIQDYAKERCGDNFDPDNVRDYVILIKAEFIANLPRPKEYPHNTVDLQGYAYNQALNDVKNVLK